MSVRKTAIGSIKSGAQFEVLYPFVREEVTLNDEEGRTITESWRPGIQHDLEGDLVADAIGRMDLTIISIHRPGSFPTRVFFTRKWTDPDGKTFGKNKLHITSMSAFKKLLNGYRHPFNFK
jgi:hypothetical protein